MALLCLALTTLQGCRRNVRPEFILPEQAAIARAAAYSAAPPPFADMGSPPPSHQVGSEVFYPQSSSHSFNPMPNYFPSDGPVLQPAPGVELAPPPQPADVQQMSGACCCQRCERLTEELERMSQRMDEFTAMMETQRLTIETLNAALLRSDANVQQLHEELAWHRGELDRLRTTMDEQQRRDYERLREISEIVDRLSTAP